MRTKRKVTKRIAAWVMCLAMVLTTVNLPVFTTEVKAATVDNVSYIDENGEEKIALSCIEIESDSTTWNAGWYVVSEDVTISDRITVNGDVHLILADGATLTASKGITVSASANFNVYAQSMAEATMGKLVAKANTKNYAGIGGIENSKVGSITINGGNVTAIGYDGAGIGSGKYGSVESITINDGVIDARDDYYEYGAGIGGGRYGRVGVIDIKGGVILSRGVGLATTSYGKPYCGNINIYDGVKSLFVTTKSDDGKGLASSEAVTFYSGSSIVDGDAKDAVFYDAEKDGVKEIRSLTKNHLVTIADAAKDGIGSNLVYAYVGETVTLTLGASANADFLKVNDGTNDLDLTDAGYNKYTFVMPNNDVIVTAEVLQTYTISLPIGMKIVSTSAESDAKGKYVTGTEIKFKVEFPYSTSNVSDGRETLTAVDGVYSVVVGSSDITITADSIRNQNVDLNEVPSDFIALEGDVFSGETSHTIHIADGATITLSGATINGGIICDGSATITLEGENNVTGATEMAGIQVGGLGTTLTIRGDGSLTALGDYYSAGIGLSQAWKFDAIGGDIVIESGNITAIGNSQWGSGIGTGVAANATVRLGNITIKGGVVKTIGGEDADGIGTGYTYNGSTNEIGTVTIYDAVDMVDASSVGKDIIYMHGDTDVSESKNVYFNIIENGERKIIYTGNPISDIEDQTYTGEAITPKPTVSLGSLNFIEGVDYEYLYTNNVNVGSSATVTVTFKGDYAEFGSVSKSFNITKAKPTVIPPTSANPKYAGTCVALVTAGSTNFGTMLYSLDDDDYSEEIPCADKGGDYTVYYKVEGSDNWFDAVGSVEIQVPVRVDVTVVGNGSVNGYDPDEFYPVGTVLMLIAEPDEDYRFTGWDDDFDAPAERKWTVLADAKDNELTVNFQHETHDFKSLGVDKHKCSVCNIETEHNYDEVTHICSNCNQEDCRITGNHDFSDQGDGTHKCQICGAKIIEITTWAQLKAAMESATEPTTIVLTQDIVATAEDKAIFPAETSIVLDLNGYTLDRNLSEPGSDNNGCVFFMQRSLIDLTIKDSSPAKTGVITGGYATTCAGCIELGSGSLTLLGGTITGNKTLYYGGGIDKFPYAKLMVGGTARVIGNYAYETDIKQWNSDIHFNDNVLDGFSFATGDDALVTEGEHKAQFGIRFWTGADMPTTLWTLPSYEAGSCFVSNNQREKYRTSVEEDEGEFLLCLTLHAHEFDDIKCTSACQLCGMVREDGIHNMNGEGCTQECSYCHIKFHSDDTYDSKGVCPQCKAHSVDDGTLLDYQGVRYRLRIDSKLNTYAEVYGYAEDIKESVVIPKTIATSNGVFRVASFANGCFQGCTRVKDVDIQAEVTFIANSTFKGCSNLTSVVIPNSVTEFRGMVFMDCSSLANITIPDGVTKIGSSTFSGCSKLVSIVIPEGVTKIESSTFEGCSNLASVVIPNSVTEIGYWAFQNCSSLASINLPEGLTTIGNYAFYGCSSLASINLPEGVTKIEDSAFEGCSSLASINLPEGLTTIGNYAFRGCSSLTDVTIPSSVISVVRSNPPFEHCSSDKLVITVPCTEYLNTVTPTQWGRIKELNMVHDFTAEEAKDEALKSAATCFDKAMYYRSCSVCGHVHESDDDVFEYGSALGHLFTEYLSNGDATTEADGTKTAVCDRGCGETDTVIDEGSRIPYSCSDGSHSFADNAEVVKIDENKHGKLCTICHVVIVTGNHDFSQSKYQTGDAGKHYQICALCQTPSEKVACTVGTPVRENEVAATCTEDGSYDEVTYCTVCKQELSRVNKTITKTGHKFTTYTSNNNATCTENATETATCENEDCGKTDTREAVNSALGHDYAAEYTVDTKATCTTAGSKSKHCSRCEAKTDVTVIPATGEHTYEDGFCSSCHAAWTKTENGFIYTAVANEAGPSVSVKATEDVIAENGKLVIPDKVSDGTTEFAVTEIAEKAFENVTGVIEVIIPETVETIGSKAFENEEIKKIDFEGTEAPTMAEDALGTNVTEISVPENATGYEQADALANVTIVKPSASPSPSEEVSASPEPSEEVSASPQPSEEVSASPSPSEEVSASPEPSEEVSASPSPSEEVSASPQPSEEVSTSPSPSNVPSEKPSDEPSVSPSPSEEVSASPEPSEEVSASPQPSEEVSASPSPSNVPSEKPSDEPSVSPSPSEEVSASPSPSEEVSTSPEPTEEVSVSPSPSEEVSTSPQPSEEVSASPEPSEEVSVSPSPSEEVSASPSPSEEVSTSPAPSTSPSVSPSVVPSTSSSIVPSVVPSVAPSKAPAVGDVAADQSTNGNYQVTAAETAKKEVTYTKPVNKQKTSYKIPDTVKIDGVVYKITKIEKNAFKNNAKVKTITAGKNIKSIGANAFKGCKKLKTLTIKSTKLTSGSVAKNAFKGITKATTIKVPKKKLKAYKTLFQKKGLSKSVKVKAI